MDHQKILTHQLSLVAHKPDILGVMGRYIYKWTIRIIDNTSVLIFLPVIIYAGSKALDL